MALREIADLPTKCTRTLTVCLLNYYFFVSLPWHQTIFYTFLHLAPNIFSCSDSWHGVNLTADHMILLYEKSIGPMKKSVYLFFWKRIEFSTRW